MFNTGLPMFFVTTRVTDHHDEGHFRKLQTLFYGFSMGKFVGFRGMGMELREIFILQFEMFLGLFTNEADVQCVLRAEIEPIL